MLFQRLAAATSSVRIIRSASDPSRTPLFATNQKAKVIASYQRWYRGDSGDMKHRSEVMEDAIAKREQELLDVAEPKFIKIQERHVRMPRLDEIPKASLPLDMDNSKFSTEDLELQVRKKRLVYRAKQRGW